MRQTLNVVKIWRLKEGIFTNPARISVLGFTKKINLQGIKDPYIFGQHLKMSKKGKYLGFTYDHKLGLN